jgi:hypothetical protein
MSRPRLLGRGAWLLAMLSYDVTFGAQLAAREALMRVVVELVATASGGAATVNGSSANRDGSGGNSSSEKSDRVTAPASSARSPSGAGEATIGDAAFDDAGGSSAVDEPNAGACACCM